MLKIAENFGSDFMFGPPIPGEYTVLDPDQAALLVRRLAESDFEGQGLAVEAVRVIPLPFYPGWLLVDLQAALTISDGGSSAGEQQSAFEDRGIHSFLYGPNGFTPLNGSSVHIHLHNAQHGVELSTPELRELYVRFFCYFVRGEDGPFEILDHSDTIDLTDIEIESDFVISSPTSASPSADNAIATFNAFVLYGEKIFKATLDLEAGGMVRMVDDMHLATGASRIPPLHYQSTLRYPAPRSDWD